MANGFLTIGPDSLFWVMDRPGVGIGVIIQNEQGQLLIGKRKGSHSPYYSIPGGHLENGETFEEAAIKEIREETGLTIGNLKLVAVTNNLRTYQESGKHYVSITFLCTQFEGVPQVMEPDKCESWNWYNPNDLPKPHFDASEWGIDNYLKGEIYHSGQA